MHPLLPFILSAFTVTQPELERLKKRFMKLDRYVVAAVRTSYGADLVSMQ